MWERTELKLKKDEFIKFIKSKGYKKGTFAKALGTSPSNFSKILSGERPITKDFKRRVIKLTDGEAEEFFYEKIIPLTNKEKIAIDMFWLELENEIKQ